MQTMKAYLPPLARLLMSSLSSGTASSSCAIRAGRQSILRTSTYQFPMCRFGFLSFSIFSLDWAS